MGAVTADPRAGFCLGGCGPAAEWSEPVAAASRLQIVRRAGRAGFPVLANCDRAKTPANRLPAATSICAPAARPSHPCFPRTQPSLGRPCRPLSPPHLPGLAARAPAPTAGAPHSPSLAWGGGAWFPASPGCCWGGWAGGSLRLGRTKRRTARREGNCSSCCCCFNRCSRPRSPLRAHGPSPWAPAPPHGASAGGSRALCVPASARCLWGRAAGRLPWLFKNDENGNQMLPARVCSGLPGRLEIGTPLPSPGVYPPRFKCTVRSITACARCKSWNPRRTRGSQPQFPGRCDSPGTYKIITPSSSSSFLATPLQSWVNWYCREGEIPSARDQKTREGNVCFSSVGEKFRLKNCPFTSQRHSPAAHLAPCDTK